MDVEIVDVGPRDGLQNATPTLDPETRAEFGRRVLAASVPRVELVSFVRADRVPQMYGPDEVIAALSPQERSRCCGLVLNERGFDRLAEAGLPGVRFTFAASDAFNQRNAGAGSDEGLERARQVVARAKAAGIAAGVVLSTSFGCPFSGEVAPQRVLALAESLDEAGADEIVFADTIGVAVPRQVREIVTGAAGLKARLGVHLHNTRSTGYACAFAAVEAGAVILDASLGGLGGCPFAPAATGNIATEDLVFMLEREGISTGVDLDALLEASEWLARLGFRVEAQLPKAGRFPVAQGVVA
jgi:hydroxymethylglutaryl-CoA lyase/(R)-citramalyl-CoA lyase